MMKGEPQGAWNANAARLNANATQQQTNAAQRMSDSRNSTASNTGYDHARYLETMGRLAKYLNNATNPFPANRAVVLDKVNACMLSLQQGSPTEVLRTLKLFSDSAMASTGVHTEITIHVNLEIIRIRDPALSESMRELHRDANRFTEHMRLYIHSLRDSDDWRVRVGAVLKDDEAKLQTGLTTVWPTGSRANANVNASGSTGGGKKAKWVSTGHTTVCKGNIKRTVWRNAQTGQRATKRVVNGVAKYVRIP